MSGRHRGPPPPHPETARVPYRIELPPPQECGTVYLGWSGGLDSTFALYDMLVGGYTVHAHHVHMVYGHGRFFEDEAQKREAALDRADAEGAAVADMDAWLRGQGFAFELSRSAVDIPGIMRLSDENVVLPHIANVAMAAGIGPRDCIVLGTNDGDYRWGYDARPARDIIAVHCRNMNSICPPIVRYGRRQSRKVHARLLPKALADAFMSCRRPRVVNGVWTPCGSMTSYASPCLAKYPIPRPCSCAELVEWSPRYRAGYLAKENEDRDYPAEA